jgi:hypothetical protein
VPTAVARMDRLPPEVLERSFRIACGDGGKTAGALRLVSHSMRQVANLHRFRAVSVSGVLALQSLLDELGQSPPALRVIEHLFVCDKPRESANVDLAHTKLPGDHLPHSRIGAQLRAREARENEEEARQFAVLLPALIGQAAASMRSFALVLFNPEHTFVLHHLHVSFPRLETLTLRYPSWIKDVDDLPATISMPNLSTLVLNIDGPFTEERHELIKRFGKQCSSIKRIVMHDVRIDSDSDWITRFLRDVVSARDAINTKLLAFVRVDIFPVSVGGGDEHSLSADYASDEWIRVHPETGHTSKYAEFVADWEQGVQQWT